MNSNVIELNGRLKMLWRMAQELNDIANQDASHVIDKTDDEEIWCRQVEKFAEMTMTRAVELIQICHAMNDASGTQRPTANKEQA